MASWKLGFGRRADAWAFGRRAIARAGERAGGRAGGRARGRVDGRAGRRERKERKTLPLWIYYVCFDAKNKIVENLIGQLSNFFSGRAKSKQSLDVAGDRTTRTTSNNNAVNT